jgi:hypothetical protein
MTTTPDIAELKRLLAEATPGPWHTDKYHAYVWGPHMEMVADTNGEVRIARARGTGGGLPIDTNIDLILAAVNAAPALLEAVEERDQLKARVTELVHDVFLMDGSRIQWKARAEKAEMELFELRDGIDHPAEGCACRFHPRSEDVLHECRRHEEVRVRAEKAEAALLRIRKVKPYGIERWIEGVCAEVFGGPTDDDMDAARPIAHDLAVRDIRAMKCELCPECGNIGVVRGAEFGFEEPCTHPSHSTDSAP